MTDDVVPGEPTKAADRWWLHWKGKKQGPFTVEKIKAALVKRQINNSVEACPEGEDQWKPLRDWPEFASTVKPEAKPEAKTPPSPPPPPAWESTGGQLKNTGAQIVGRFKQIDFATEVFPLNADNAKKLASEPSFWAVVGLAGLPALFAIFRSQEHQISALTIYFAAIWGLVFRYNIVPDITVKWKWLIASFVFTGMIGIPAMLYLLQFMPEWYLMMPHSETAVMRFLGTVLNTGLWEETVKLVPVLLILLLLRNRLAYGDIVMLGVFSGLGFAAFENMHYVRLSVFDAFESTAGWGLVGLEVGVQGAVINALVRSTSVVFGHAVYSGITAHFIATGRGTGSKRLPLAITGIAVVSVVHGTYNTVSSMAFVLGVAVDVVAFMLLKIYMTQGANTEIDGILGDGEPLRADSTGGSDSSQPQDDQAELSGA